MTGKRPSPGNAAELRKRAEEVARQREAQGAEKPEALTAAAVQQRLHELRVHQIELEMQNEELRTTQVALDDASARYFDLYDLAPVGYITISEPGLIEEGNLTAATLLGVPRASLAKRPFARFLLPEDQDIYYLHRTKLFKTGERQTCDVRMVKGDGTLFWTRIDATAALDANGQRTCRMAISDITEHKRAEDALAASERRFRGLAELLPQTVFETDLDLNVIFLNHRSLVTFGYTVVDYEAGMDGLRLFIPTDRSRIVQNARARLRGDLAEVNEYTALRKDGSTFPVLVSSVPIIQDGVPVGFRGIIVDITQGKQAETELRHHREQLRTLAAELSTAEERERRRIAAGLHDGANQLQFAAMLKLGLMRKIVRSPRALSILGDTEELLGCSIRETRSLTFDLASPLLYEIGLAAALRDLCERMQARYHLHVSFDDGGEDAPVPDEVAIVLFQAVRELLTNVAKHAHATTAEVGMARPDSMLCICVLDDGVGFDATYAGSGVSQTGGFGLFNIGERLRRIGGRLRFDSSPGKGACILLEVPLEP